MKMYRENIYEYNKNVEIGAAQLGLFLPAKLQGRGDGRMLQCIVAVYSVAVYTK